MTKSQNNGGLLIIINNHDGRILPSETFFTAHINLLPGTVIPLVGIPGNRLLINEGRKSIPSRSTIPLALRWIFRSIGLSNIANQDRKALAKFLRKRKISAVLAEYGPAAVSVMDACRDTSTPLITHFHGFDAYKHDIISNFGKKYLELFKQSCAIVAVSEHMRKQLLSLGAEKEKTFVNSCGADIPDDHIANPALSEIRFLMVGRLVEKKAPFLSIMAFSKVAAIHPESSLEIVGDGPLLNVCKILVQSLGLSNNVTFHGALSHKEVFSMMRKSRCFIQHSICTPDGDHEGTPVGVLEAMGMALPVVATRHGGILDVIEDGVNGSLVNEYDIEGMANSMLSYASDPSLAHKIGQLAHSRIKENWTSHKSIGRLWKIIEPCLNN